MHCLALAENVRWRRWHQRRSHSWRVPRTYWPVTYLWDIVPGVPWQRSLCMEASEYNLQASLQASASTLLVVWGYQVKLLSWKMCGLASRPARFLLWLPSRMDCDPNLETEINPLLLEVAFYRGICHIRMGKSRTSHFESLKNEQCLWLVDRLPRLNYFQAVYWKHIQSAVVDFISATDSLFSLSLKISF